MSWNDGRTCRACLHWRRGDDAPSIWGTCTRPAEANPHRTEGSWCPSWEAGSHQAALSRYRLIRARVRQLGVERQKLLEEQEALVSEAMQLGRRWDLPVEDKKHT